ncbi:helix-turn-helix domain-containing protein [Chryseobacterium sp. 18068]|uniref:helix-turn-helix domain-containing protein n=1 Tax=Chryseobacterium sp. 18068 TaxID=2681414 RepID=UPI00135780F7|nr:helix-turn-helix domain-containing protein [Chryseobacterium sp. 18068]
MLNNLISIFKVEVISSKKSSSDRSEILSRVKSIADQIIQIRLDTGKSLVFATPSTSELKMDYIAINNLFLYEHGVSLERVFVMRIIEKVKEMLVYTEQSLTQIVSALGYQNSSSLSNLLKKTTGFTSAHFKKIRKNKLEIIRRQQTE